MSDSLWPHRLLYASLPCPSLSPGVCSNSCPLSKWWHSTILCYPLLLPSIFPSIRVSSSESALHIRWPKYWSFSISPSNEYSGLSSFRIDWFDLLAVQGILKGLLQHHSLKASILWLSDFFMVQLSHPYMTTGKTIALTRWTLSILKERNQPWIFIGRTDAEAPVLWLSGAKSRLVGTDPDAGKNWKQKKRATDDAMVGWHHWLNGHEFKQTLGDSVRQRSLGCHRPWGCKESDST